MCFRRRTPWCAPSRGAVATLLLVALGLPAAAEEPRSATEERDDVVVLDEECLESSIRLSGGWSYQPGDDPAWADPDFDDSAWPLVAPALADLDAVPGGWSGIGWFRRRIQTTAGFGDRPLGLYVHQGGASEVYLNGRLVARFGTVSSTIFIRHAIIDRTGREWVAKLLGRYGRKQQSLRSWIRKVC